MTIQQEIQAAARLRRRVLERAERSTGGLTDSQAEMLRETFLASARDPVDEDREPPRSGRRHRPLRLFLATAAAAVLLVGLWQSGLIDPTSNSNLGDELELLSPEGRVSALSKFSWRYENFLPGGHCLFVVEPENGPRYEARIEDGVTSWTPPPEVATQWSSFTWYVEAHGPDGRDRTSEKVRVQVTEP